MRRFALLLATICLVAGCTSAPVARPLASPSPSPSPTPQPSPSPSPAPADHGPVPAAVPVFYVAEPLAGNWLTAFDWTGKPVGTLKLPAGTRAGLVSQDATGDVVYVDGRFYDRRGEPIGSALPVTDKAPPVWSEDGSRVCGLRGSSDPSAAFRYVLWTAPIGGAPRDVGPLGPVTQAGQVGESVLACSRARDLALVVRTAVAWPTDLWFVRLSTGAVVGHKTYTSAWLSNIVAAPDARLLAENASGFQGQGGQTGAPATLVRSVDSGAALRSLGQDSVWAFSGDGAAVLIGVAGTHAVYIGQVAGGASSKVSLPGVLAFAFPEPGGHDFFIGVQGDGGAYTVELITGSGARAVPQ